MNASLLRSSSDVFSAMLSGDWRESSHGLSSFSLPSYACTDKVTKLTRKTCVLCLRYGSHVFFCLFSGQIEVKNFEAQAFRVFLDWLALSLNASFRNETDFAQRAQCMCTPHVI